MNDKDSNNLNDLILAASLASIGLSVYLYTQGRKEDGLFVGLWAPTFLGLAAFVNGTRASARGDRSSRLLPSSASSAS